MNFNSDCKHTCFLYTQKCVMGRLWYMKALLIVCRKMELKGNFCVRNLWNPSLNFSPYVLSVNFLKASYISSPRCFHYMPWCRAQDSPGLVLCLRHLPIAERKWLKRETDSEWGVCQTGSGGLVVRTQSRISTMWWIPKDLRGLPGILPLSPNLTSACRPWEPLKLWIQCPF